MMPPDPHQIEEWLSGMLDGVLSEEEQQQPEGHAHLMAQVTLARPSFCPILSDYPMSDGQSAGGAKVYEGLELLVFQQHVQAASALLDHRSLPDRFSFVPG